MKERGGIATTIALLLAAMLGVSYIPRKAAETTGTAAASRPAGKGSSGAGSAEQAGKASITASCQQIAKRLQRFYPTTVPIPGSAGGGCYGEGVTGPDAATPTTNGMSFVIAIVPNPVQTHLPLLFDRAIESIQQAAQDLNFNYDNSWFPWNPSDKSYDSLSDEEQAARLDAVQQQQPGIMVFRVAGGGSQVDPFGRGLVIFVVGEQPTGGISDAQFEHALQWVNTLEGAPAVNVPLQHKLRIIGPTFSGSLVTLERELIANAAFTKYPQGIEIYSGGTNAAESVRGFQQFLSSHNPQADGKTQELYRFRTFLESDSLMTDRFLCYLQHEGYNLNRVAILSEDQTAFGKAAKKTKPDDRSSSSRRCQEEVDDDTAGQQPIFLYYPRDIATLRSAYEKQSIFSAGKQQANAPATELRGSLSEPASAEHDTVRTYGGQLTPLAQEAALFGIANILERKEIEFIILRSSNSLDQLFLSEFLRRSYPNGRVVISGTDVLFRRGIEGASLRGVMLLSTYPLLSWTQDAIPSIHGQPDGSASAARKSSFRVFPQDLSEGVYIAARALLEQLPDIDWSVPISDYGVPASAQSNTASPENHRPATWLSVVGHRQFWAIAILNDNTESNTSKFGPVDALNASLLEAEPSAPSGGDSASAPASSPGGGKPAGSGWVRDLPGEMTTALLACIAIGFWHLYCCWNGSIIKSPRVRAYFAPVAREQHGVLIFLGSLVLGLLGIVVGMVFIVGESVMADLLQFGVFAGCGLILVCAVLGCWKNYHLPIASGDGNPAVIKRIVRKKRKLFWALAPSLVVAAILFFLFLPNHLNPANRFPAFWRSLNLRSGVSPLLPQLLLLTGFYAWFWHTLHGLALFGDDRPVLPSVDELPKFPASIDPAAAGHPESSRLVKMFRMFSREGAGDNIERNAMPLGRSYVKSLVILFPLAVFALWMALDGFSFRNLGDRRFGSLIFFAIAVSIALVSAETLQLLNIWSQLRQLLIFLDRLRIRRTLCTLRNLYGGSVWKLSGNVLEERYRLLSRQFESMSNLQNSLQEWTVSDAQEAGRKQTVMNKVAECQTKGHTFATWYVDLLDDDIKDQRKFRDMTPLTEFQLVLASTAASVLSNVILPAWQADTESLLCSSGSKDKPADASKTAAGLPQHVRAAEEFFLLPYLGFVQNTLGRVRTIALSIVSVFVAATLAVSSYPFDPLPVIGAVFLILFVLVGATMIVTYAEMSRDATLSHVANTSPGELGWDFWVKMAALGAGPLIGLLTTLFPSMTDFIVSFLQPGAQAFK